jgi:hypothetical protein
VDSHPEKVLRWEGVTDGESRSLARASIETGDWEKGEQRLLGDTTTGARKTVDIRGVWIYVTKV